mgnify:CR=1 FL=1
MRTQHIPLSSGIPVPVLVPNTTMDGDNFYVSFNDYDHGIYGGDTTALVLGQMQHFYILNGDHRAAYAELIPQGIDACLSYFKANIADINKRSETISD